jgi:hypothetical protein
MKLIKPITNGRLLFVSAAYYADPQFFKAIDFGWLAGDKKIALTEPYSTCLNKLKKSNAEAFFYWHQVYLLDSVKDL